MLKKQGTPEKIKDVVKTEKEFEELKDKVAEENDLSKCSNCGRLIEKKEVISKEASVSTKCDKCDLDKEEKGD